MTVNVLSYGVGSRWQHTRMRDAEDLGKPKPWLLVNGPLAGETVEAPMEADYLELQGGCIYMRVTYMIVNPPELEGRYLLGQHYESIKLSDEELRHTIAMSGIRPL